MSRLSPKIETIRALFARSGNKCAFPGCIQPLLNDSNKFIGQICHIEAASPDGERYNPKQTDEERRSYSNLILLCYPHHIETNDTLVYTVNKLKKIKSDHESFYEKNPFKIDETALYKIVYEMDEYWSMIEKLNTYEHSFIDFALPIKAKGSFFEIISSVRQTLKDVDSMCSDMRETYLKQIDDFKILLVSKNIPESIFKDLSYESNPFKDRLWETYSLGISNSFIKLTVEIIQLELKYLEEYLKINSNDISAKQRFDYLKKEFKDLAQNAGLYD